MNDERTLHFQGPFDVVDNEILFQFTRAVQVIKIPAEAALSFAEALLEKAAQIPAVLFDPTDKDEIPIVEVGEDGVVHINLMQPMAIFSLSREQGERFAEKIIRMVRAAAAGRMAVLRRT